MLEIKLTPKAHQDIENIYAYILKDGKSIASKQVSLICLLKVMNNVVDVINFEEATSKEGFSDLIPNRLKNRVFYKH